jgi:hypothetical protein
MKVATSAQRQVDGRRSCEASSMPRVRCRRKSWPLLGWRVRLNRPNTQAPASSPTCAHDCFGPAYLGPRAGRSRNRRDLQRRLSDPALLSIRQPEAICEIADNLGDRRRRRPMCALAGLPDWPRHRAALDPWPVVGKAVWYCPRKEHAACLIGELRTADDRRSLLAFRSAGRSSLIRG